MSMLSPGLILYPHSCNEEVNWKAGTAKAIITPDKPLWLAGYGGREHPADGTIHDLSIKVLALEDSKGHKAVVLTSDLLGFPKIMYDSICSMLRENFGLARSQIMLTSSHTHSGPVLREALVDCYPLDDAQMSLIKNYSQALEKKIVATIAEALSEMRPARLSAGERICGFAVNRRNNREAEIPQLLEQGDTLKGPVDHSVPVLAVRTTEGQLLALAFGYACHNTTLSSYQWCGDYAGFAQIALEKKHPGTMAMFYMGCGADQNPLPRRSVELCESYGNMLAAAVDEVLEKPMRQISPSLRTSFEFVTLNFERNPTREELQTSASDSGIRGRWAQRLLKKMENGECFSTTYPYPVQVWKLGDKQLWISLGGEVVVDYSLLFKSKYGPSTWVTGYANDVMSYIPSRRVFDEGGYESGALCVYGAPAEQWSPDVEGRIVASVQRLVHS